jgi:hypothetical protein
VLPSRRQKIGFFDNGGKIAWWVGKSKTEAQQVLVEEIFALNLTDAHEICAVKKRAVPNFAQDSLAVWQGTQLRRQTSAGLLPLTIT